MKLCSSFDEKKIQSHHLIAWRGNQAAAMPCQTLFEAPQLHLESELGSFVRGKQRN